jgi:hypothetical protein
MRIEFCARYMVQGLRDLGAHIVYQSRHTGSTYIKFDDDRIGSLRVSDHPGRPKYRYRWNLLTAGEDGIREVQDGPVRRFFYPASIQHMDWMIQHIRRYKASVDRSDAMRTHEVI